MRLIVRAALILILLAVYVTAWATDTALVDRDGVTQPLVLTPANIGAASTAQARSGATYTILPYGDTRLADYYCTATDCGPAFQSALNAAKSSGKGGMVKLLEGTYPVATSAVGNDAHSVIIEGVSPMGMWGDGGTIIRRTANVTVFDFSGGTPRACEVSRIHFTDAAVYSAPVLNYGNTAANMGQFHNYFDGNAQAIYAENPWDFWTLENNFRQCGTGDTRNTACIAIYNGSTGKAAGWMIGWNRFEQRPGTSIYSDATGSFGVGNDTINISFNKFEGIDGTSFPAIHGEFWGARIIGNSIYKADTAKPPIWIVNQGAVPSGLNVVQGNRVSNHKDYAISVAGNANNIGGNTFDTTYTPAAHIRVDSGTGNKIGVNAATGSITMLSDAGTSTQTINSAAYLGVSGNGTEVATVSGTKTAGKQATFDANGNVIASAYDTGAAGGGGSGTVSSGTAGQIAYYQSNGTTVTGKSLTVGDVSGAQGTLTNSAGLASAISDETGTGNAVFSASPSLTGTPAVTATLTSITTNGTFDSDLTGWTATSNWAWSSGKALHSAGGSAVLYSTGTVTSGALYKVSFDVSGMTTGTIAPTGGGWSSPPTITANGSYVFYLASTSTAAVGFAPSTTFDGALDNVVIAAVTGGLSVGDNFALTGAGQFVGIGTTAPTAPLEIFGNGINSLAYITAYSGGDNASFTPSIVGRGARGIQSTPIQSKTGDTLMLVGARGHDGTSFSAFSKGDLGIYAGENWTSTAQGTYIAFRTTASGGTTRSEKLRINSGGMMTEGLDDKTASFTVVNSTSRITLASGTATATLKKDLPAGTTSVLVTVAGAAASGVSFVAESGGSLSWGDAGAPTFTNSKIADVVCTSENAAATSTAAWRCVKGGNF